MIENYEGMHSDSLKHLCQVTYHANMNRECQIYLETLINKEEKLDKEMQILFPTNFKKIFYVLKKQIMMLNEELKALTKFSKKKNKKKEENKQQKNEENEDKVNLGYSYSNFRRNSIIQKQNEDKKKQDNKNIKNIDNEFRLDPDKDKELISYFLSELRATIANYNTEIKNKIMDFNNLLNKLINGTNNEIDKAYYEKLSGDFNRYSISLYLRPTDKKKYIKKSEDSYLKGIEILNNVSFKDPVKLSIYLNYAVLLFEEKNDKNEAINNLNLCLNECNQLDNDLCDDSRKILFIMKENKAIWELDKTVKKNEIDEHFDDDDFDDEFDNEDEKNEEEEEEDNENVKEKNSESDIELEEYKDFN